MEWHSAVAPISGETVAGCRALRRMGFTFKKKSLVADERRRAAVTRARHDWTSRRQPLMRESPERLVFIDETWIKTNMAPLRGWGPKGERLRAFVPHGHWRTLTFLGALRCDRTLRACSMSLFKWMATVALRMCMWREAALLTIPRYFPVWLP